MRPLPSLALGSAPRANISWTSLTCPRLAASSISRTSGLVLAMMRGGRARCWRAQKVLVEVWPSAPAFTEPSSRRRQNYRKPLSCFLTATPRGEFFFLARSPEMSKNGVSRWFVFDIQHARSQHALRSSCAGVIGNGSRGSACRFLRLSNERSGRTQII